MAAFPQSWLEELHARNDIVEVIGNYITLNPKGGRYWGLCPFHGEKTPSFSVSSDKQLYYCFGCHVGGDVIHFLRTMEKLSYMEAVHMLANRANLALPETIDDKEMQRERDQRERFYRINRETARFFHGELRGEGGQSALAYLQKRGIGPGTIQKFGVGYAAGGRLTKYLLKQGHAREDLLALGLTKEREGENYDAFRNRVIFPIIARNKQVIGFGGRLMGEGQPKYLNSPENLVFSKRRNLYGLNLLRGKDLDAIILVEGYMDVISLVQAGLSGVAATLGTALTQQQARLIKTYASRVYLAYDGDSAGQNAALKGIDILQKEGLDVSVIQFPTGQDPDDFARTHGKEGIEELCKTALASNGFKLAQLKSRFDLGTAEGQEGYAKEGSAFIQRLSPVEQERYFAQLSRETDYSVDTLRKEGARYGGSALTGNREKKRSAIGPKAVPLAPEGMSKARLMQEQSLIAVAASHKEAMVQVLGQQSLFATPAYAAFFQAAASMPEASLATILASLSEDLIPHVTAAINANLGVYDAQEVERGLQNLWRLQVREEIDQLQKESDGEDTLVSKRIACTIRIKELNDLLDSVDNMMDATVMMEDDKKGETDGKSNQ